MGKRKPEIIKRDKLSKHALSYIESSLRAAMHDCSDSMHDKEITKAKFDALADDEFTIEEYITKFHLDEYVQGVKDVSDEEGADVSDWEDYLSNTPSTIPIPYSEIKHLLV